MPQTTTVIGETAFNNGQVIALDSRKSEQVVSDKQYLKILQVSDLLSRHLHLNEIMSVFCKEVMALVPHDGMHYSCQQLARPITYGQTQGHHLQYHLTLQQMEVGDLVVISGQSGATIRLQDLATITDRFEQDENKIMFNGQRAAVLNITKTRSQDILRAVNDVKAFVEAENQSNPPNIRLTLTQDVASLVQDRLSMIVKNGVQGLILVFLILWLFFSLRYSFWVTMGLPISFLGALFVLPLAGVTINMISLVGLLIGIGLLMDDAIVIAENIAARLHKGERAMQASVAGVTQVLPGIMSSFATTLLVFGSLTFITGEIGQILRVMPIVLIIVLTVSLVEAFLVLPNHLGHSLKHIENRQDSAFRMRFDQGFDHFRDRVFGVAVDKAIEYRYLTLGIVMMLIGASDTGKTSFARKLVRAAVGAGKTAAYIDADVDKTTTGPPACA